MPSQLDAQQLRSLLLIAYYAIGVSAPEMYQSLVEHAVLSELPDGAHHNASTVHLVLWMLKPMEHLKNMVFSSEKKHLHSPLSAESSLVMLTVRLLPL